MLARVVSVSGWLGPRTTYPTKYMIWLGGITLAATGHRYSLLRIHIRANQPAMGGR